MVAKHKQDHFARREIFRLINRVAVTFLLALHGKTDAPLETAHLFRLAQQRRIFLQPLQVIIVRPAQIMPHHFILARLDDDANLLDAGGFEFQQVIMKQRARNAVRCRPRGTIPF